MSGERLKIVLFFLLIIVNIASISNADYPDYKHIQLNIPYYGYVESNETISHKVYINQEGDYTHISFKITVIPDNNSNADIVLEYWNSNHFQLMSKSDKKNYSKPEEINIFDLLPSGDIYIDVYTSNNIGTNYTLSVESQLMKNLNIYDIGQYFWLILVIIGFFLFYFFYRYFFDSVYYRISRWRFKRNYRKQYGREYNERDINIFHPASQRVDDNELIFSINNERKSLIKTILKILSAISFLIMLIGSLCAIFGVTIWDFI